MLKFQCMHLYLGVEGLVGAGVVIFLRNVGAGLRVTTTCVGAALGLLHHGQRVVFSII